MLAGTLPTIPTPLYPLQHAYLGFSLPDVLLELVIIMME